MRTILRSRETCFFARAGQTAGSSTSLGMTEHGVVTIFCKCLRHGSNTNSWARAFSTAGPENGQVKVKPSYHALHSSMA
jgi:hypothetical protein